MPELIQITSHPWFSGNVSKILNYSSVCLWQRWEIVDNTPNLFILDKINSVRHWIFCQRCGAAPHENCPCRSNFPANTHSEFLTVALGDEKMGKKNTEITAVSLSQKSVIQDTVQRNDHDLIPSSCLHAANFVFMYFNILLTLLDKS